MTLDGYKAELRKGRERERKVEESEGGGETDGGRTAGACSSGFPLPASLNRLVSLKMKENAIIDDYEFVKTRK